MRKTKYRQSKRSAERERTAVRLRKAGKSYRQIAKEIGCSSALAFYYANGRTQFSGRD